MSSTAVLLVLLSAGADDAAGKPSASQEQRRQAEVAVLAPAKAKQLELWSGEGAKAQLHEEPLLRWSNPTAGSVYGEVFLWSIDGRPAALASVYRWYHPYTDATVEFASIWDRPIAARDGEASVWDSKSPGVAFKPLENAAAPSSSAGLRLVQMKSLAREFSAQLVDERGGEQVERELRLLNQPLHRYAAPKQQIVDGALFAFVEGTDPEAWVMIEAVNAEGQLQWRYGLARMNVDALEIRRSGVILQTWPQIRQAWRNRAAPYTLFSFDPRLVKPQKEAP
jgi:hypothetical protein